MYSHWQGQSDPLAVCVILECPLKAKKRTLNILAYFRGLLLCRHRASSTGPFMWKKSENRTISPVCEYERRGKLLWHILCT